MNLWEALMMFCFGIGWPVAIHKTIKEKNPAGKSVAFSWIIVAGYLAGIIHKLDNPDWVLFLYIINTAMVLIDLALMHKYRHRNNRPPAAVSTQHP